LIGEISFLLSLAHSLHFKDLFPSARFVLIHSPGRRRKKREPSRFVDDDDGDLTFFLVEQRKKILISLNRYRNHKAF
jgi:hypothetical protein